MGLPKSTTQKSQQKIPTMTNLCIINHELGYTSPIYIYILLLLSKLLLLLLYVYIYIYILYVYTYMCVCVYLCVCIYIYIYHVYICTPHRLQLRLAQIFPCNPCPLQKAVKCHIKNPHWIDPFQGNPARDDISLLPRAPDWLTVL